MNQDEPPKVIKWKLSGAELYFAGFTEHGASTWTLTPENGLWCEPERVNKILILLKELEAITSIEVENLV